MEKLDDITLCTFADSDDFICIFTSLAKLVCIYFPVDKMIILRVSQENQVVDTDNAFDVAFADIQRKLVAKTMEYADFFIFQLTGDAGYAP